MVFKIQVNIYISIYLYKIIYICRIIDDLYIGMELRSFILEDFYNLFLDISIKLQRNKVFGSWS